LKYAARGAALLLLSLIVPACIQNRSSTLALAPTTLTAAAVSTGRIELSWVDQSTNEFEFRIERSDDGGTTYTQVGAAPMNAQTYSDLGLSSGTSYLYRVRAWNSKGNSDFAGPAGATTAALAWAPGPMTGGPAVSRINHSAVFDSLQRRMIVFGGIDDFLNVYNELWFFDLSGASIPPPSPPSSPLWKQPTTTGIVAPLRMAHSAVFDLGHNRMVLFGGLDDSFVQRNEVFVLDLDTLTWSQPAVTGTPPTPRGFHTAVYDAANEQMIVFGGSDGTFELSGLYVLSLSDATPFAWSTPAAGSGPIGREQHAAVYDSLRQRMVLFGGLDNNIISDGSVLNKDAWSLSPAAPWIPIGAVGGPGVRFGHSGVYDATNQRMLIFGGDTTTLPTLTSELWSLRLDGAETWSLLSPSGTPPLPRYAHTAIYDSIFNRMILYGGWDGLTVSFNEIWVIQL